MLAGRPVVLRRCARTLICRHAVPPCCAAVPQRSRATALCRCAETLCWDALGPPHRTAVLRRRARTLMCHHIVPLCCDAVLGRLCAATLCLLAVTLFWDTHAAPLPRTLVRLHTAPPGCDAVPGRSLAATPCRRHALRHFAGMRRRILFAFFLY